MSPELYTSSHIVFPNIFAQLQLKTLVMKNNPSRSREVILQNLARFLQRTVILQDLARWRLFCKILQDRGYLARILEEGGYLARILQDPCKNLARILQDNHPKISVEKHKKTTETRCKIKKIDSRTRFQNFFGLI